MKLRIRNGLLFLLATGMLVVTAGCPNSTVIKPANGTATFNMFNVNLGRWDLGFLSVDEVLIRPVDPVTNQALDSTLSLFLASDVFNEVTLPQIDSNFMFSVDLSEGVYEITKLSYSGIYLEDFDATSTATCASYQSFWSPPDFFTITNFPTPLTFTVTRGADALVSLTLDVDAMANALAAASTCTPGCGGFCVTGFNPTTFKNLYPSYLSID